VTVDADNVDTNGDAVDADNVDTNGDAVDVVVEAVIFPVAMGAAIVNLSSIISAIFAVGFALLSNVFLGAAFRIFQRFIWHHIKRQIKRMIYQFLKIRALQIFRFLGDVLGILILLATPSNQVEPRVSLFFGICIVWGAAVALITVPYYCFTRKALINFRTSIEVAVFMTLVMPPIPNA
jgi:uncharacterized membrane protein YciS (DUF1049 family)